MTAMRRIVVMLVSLLPSRLLMRAQPLANPMADFDKLVSQLNAGNVVGDVIRAGDTAVIPFAAIKFDLDGGGASKAFGGGMGVKTMRLRNDSRLGADHRGDDGRYHDHWQPEFWRA